MHPDKISNGTICMSPIKGKEMKRTELNKGKHFSLCATVTRANVQPIFLGRFTDHNNKKRFQLILSEEIPSLNLIVLITVRIQNNYVRFQKIEEMIWLFNL